MSDLEPIQRSRLGEIGQLLAKAREEKGLTLEEVSGKTLIRAAILKAIEEGDARPLPEPVYIRGFIRRFGDLVGLNGMELCDSFPWQPSGSVPLSFVSTGNEAASVRPVAKQEAAPVEPPSAPMVAEPEIAAPPIVAEMPESPDLDIPPAETAAVDDAPLVGADDNAAVFNDVAASVTDAEADDRVEVGAESFDGDRDKDAAPVELNVSEAPVASATPDHEAAYESRAALFEDEPPKLENELKLDDEAKQFDEAEADGGAGAAAIAATPAMSQSDTAVAESAVADGPEAAVSGGGVGVATLPQPPAPVMYREPEQRNLMPWILAVVAGAVGLGIALLAFGGGNRQTAPTTASGSAPVEQVEGADSGSATGDVPSATATPNEAEPTPAQATVPADKVVLELEVKGSEDAWMDVLVDGELQIEGNQVPGFKQRWEGNQEIELATARPDMVWISVNGSQPQPFGTFAEANPVKIGAFKPANAQ